MIVVLKHNPNRDQLESLIAWLQDKGITVESVRIVDNFTVWFEVARLELKALRKLADKRVFDLKIVGQVIMVPWMLMVKSLLKVNVVNIMTSSDW